MTKPKNPNIPRVEVLAMKRTAATRGERLEVARVLVEARGVHGTRVPGEVARLLESDSHFLGKKVLLSSLA